MMYGCRVSFHSPRTRIGVAGRRNYGGQSSSYLCRNPLRLNKYRTIIQLKRRAVSHHTEVETWKLFDAWRVYTGKTGRGRKQAKEFYPKCLVKKVFLAWRRLPQELKREAEREKIRMEMRKKVADLLPAFQPPSVAQSTDSTL